MKSVSILFLFLFSLTAHSMSVVDATALAPVEKAEREIKPIAVKFQNPLRDIEINLTNYSTLLTTFNEFKAFDVEYANNLLKKVQGHDTLSGTELFVLRRIITAHYKINKKILDFAKVYDFGGFKMSKTFATDHNLPLIKAHLIWLSGHLLVLDHLETMHNILYERDGTFRRIVKNALLDKTTSTDGVSKTINDLIKMDEYSAEIGEGEKFSQQINLVVAIQNDLKTILANEPSAIQLVNEIATNPSAIKIVQGKKEFKLNTFKFSDFFVDIVDQITGVLSGTFGNIAGAIRWREGHLYKNPTALEIARSHLQPMDIVIEKSPFVLTDKFIPGHFGHVAIYLGTKEQLEAIGMWNHPDIIPYQNEIASGKVILEAVRSGVHLNSLEEFMNIDEFSIIRKSDALTNDTLLSEEITRGMDQIGKPYDFNFDISTLDKIVCSELIYIFYGNVHWPTQYRLGRPTITPDDIAEILFYKGTKFSIINFMVAKEEHKIEMVNISYIAGEMDYELRKSDGSPIEEQNDSTNSYWKKETKCYSVTVPDKTFGREDFRTNQRACKTSYREFFYEEKDTI